MKLERSKALKARAAKVIPGVTQTFSKGPTAFVQGAAPVFLESASGSRVRDVDGNEYIDYIMGLGPIVLGYGFPEVVEAVQCHLGRGSVVYSLPHSLEVELAETLVELIPCAEMVRFGKNGSDATAGAVRLARAFTGRETVAFCGYHGWQDWYVAATTRDKGVPACLKPLSLEFKYNDLASLQRLFDENPNQIAAVILEPLGTIEPQSGFLQEVRALAHKHGALLVFDEIITGFRLGLGGAQEHFDVVPDLACFGKAMANGFPISALVGRREIMQGLEEVFFSFTFGGELSSIVATQATIEVMKKQPVFEHLWRVGGLLKDGLNELIRNHDLVGCISCQGLPPRTALTFSPTDGLSAMELKSYLQQEVIRNGVLFNGNHFVSFSHSEDDIAQTLQAYDEALRKLAQALASGNLRERLLGDVVQPVFRRP